MIVETPKQARRFLLAAGVALSQRRIRFHVLDEHSPDTLLPEILAPALAGSDMGLLSDAGCPGIADPGASLVRHAHAAGIAVMPLVGPSSIVLALMGSGLNGQRFAFHGYLPIEVRERTRALAALEQRSRARDETQIFIETPYRNNRMLAAIIHACSASCLLCLAADLTLPSQLVATRTIGQWRRRTLPDLDRRPAVFLLSAGATGDALVEKNAQTPLGRLFALADLNEE
ncbi:MAG: SAM-dependent methyltransferase [Burkholderiales bacterium]|nr:SAM-dependent methyltransferase [Burkholderiales bacterium]